MHEFSLLKGIMKKLNDIAEQEQVDRIEHIKIRIGALAHISVEHFKAHFQHAARGGVAEHAQLEVIQLQDQQDPQAQEIILESVKVAQKTIA